MRASNKDLYAACCRLAIAALLFSCSANRATRSLDILTAEDSIIIGRLRFLPAPGCNQAFQLPAFELRNETQGESTPFTTLEWTNPKGVQYIEVPITLKADPGTYQLRIKTTQTPRQSLWLDRNLLTLKSFDVTPGRLVYFGTIEVEIGCEKIHRHGRAHYLGHTVRNELTLETKLLRQQFPDVFERYEDKIDLQVPPDAPENEPQ